MTKAANTLTDAQIRIAVETLIAEGDYHGGEELSWEGLRRALVRRKAQAQKELGAIGDIEAAPARRGRVVSSRYAPGTLSFRGITAPIDAPKRRGRPRKESAIAVLDRRSGRKPLTPALAKSRKLQGMYLNLIRQIAPVDRGTYQQMVRNDPKHGRRDAIAAMQAALGDIVASAPTKRRKRRSRK